MDDQSGHKAMRLAFAACVCMTIFTAKAATIAPRSYSTTIDRPTATATFSIQFDRAPDLFTVDTAGRQADSFQFWTDSNAPDPVGRAYAGLFGELPPDTQAVITAVEIPRLNQLEIVWVKPLTWEGPRSSGGWGSVEQHVAYTLTDDHLLSFTMPLSFLRDTDGDFYYAFETYDYGSWGGQTFSGIRGERYEVPPVPDPACATLLVVGAATLLAWQRRRRTDAISAPCG